MHCGLTPLPNPSCLFALPSCRPLLPATFVQDCSDDDNILSVAAAKIVNANANNSISLLIRRSFPWITLAADKRPSATCLTIVPFSGPDCCAIIFNLNTTIEP